MISRIWFWSSLAKSSQIFFSSSLMYAISIIKIWV